MSVPQLFHQPDYAHICRESATGSRAMPFQPGHSRAQDLGCHLTGLTVRTATACDQSQASAPALMSPYWKSVNQDLISRRKWGHMTVFTAQSGISPMQPVKMVRLRLAAAAAGGNRGLSSLVAGLVGFTTAIGSAGPRLALRVSGAAPRRRRRRHALRPRPGTPISRRDRPSTAPAPAPRSAEF